VVVAVLIVVCAVLLLTAVLLWDQRVGDVTEITEAEALDRLSSGFAWEYEHPGFLTFTLPDGERVVLEGGTQPARWYVPLS
jgi:hypothetical protein